MTKEKRPTDKPSARGKKRHSNTASAQRRRLHAELMQRPVSTIQARHELDILAPAARVYELRHGEGHNILRHWETVETLEGNKHRVAVYILKPGKWKGGGA